MDEVETSINLTRDELLAVLHVMGTQSMNGLPPEPLAGRSELEIEEQLNAGFATLVNRGLLDERSPDELVFDDRVLGLVGAAVVPEATVLLSFARPDGSSDPHYFSATPVLIVEHWSPRAGLHQFNLLPEAETLQVRARAVVAELAMRPGAGPTLAGSLSDERLTAVLKAGRSGDGAAARQILGSAGWPATAAAALADDWVDLGTLWTAVAAWGLREEEPAGTESVMVLVGQERTWLATMTSLDPIAFALRTVSGAEAAAALLRLLDHLQPVGARA